MYGGHVIEDGPEVGALGGPVRLARRAAYHTRRAPRNLPAEVL
jgi:hypothetical protein